MSDAIFNLILNIDFSFIFLFHLFFSALILHTWKFHPGDQELEQITTWGGRFLPASSTPHPYPIPST